MRLRINIFVLIIIFNFSCNDKVEKKITKKVNETKELVKSTFEEAIGIDTVYIDENIKSTKSEGCGCSFIYTSLKNSTYLTINFKEFEYLNNNVGTRFNIKNMDVFVEKTRIDNYCSDMPITGHIAISEEDNNIDTISNEIITYQPIQGEIILSKKNNCDSVSYQIKNAVFVFNQDSIFIQNLVSRNIDLSNYPS